MNVTMLAPLRLSIWYSGEEKTSRPLVELERNVAMDMNYASIKQLAKQIKRPVTSLIALASANDPFYQNAPRQRTLAEWFARIYDDQHWERFRNHIRRCHYQIVSLDIWLPNGKRYLNSFECWRTLLQASKSA
jgi:hypothetical protein